jgi:hypothetical protein
VVKELRVQGHDHGQRRLARLLRVGGDHRRNQPLPRRRAVQENVAPGLRVHRGRPPFQKLVKVADRLFRHGAVGKFVEGMGFAEKLVEDDRIKNGFHADSGRLLNCGSSNITSFRPFVPQCAVSWYF